MRSKTGSILIECDGCPARVTIEIKGDNPPGWARVTIETFDVHPGTRLHTISGTMLDLCPRCVATIPQRTS